eukprot:6186504-Pleurochrysis_carterae.AAC.1
MEPAALPANHTTTSRSILSLQHGARAYSSLAVTSIIECTPDSDNAKSRQRGRQSNVRCPVCRET